MVDAMKENTGPLHPRSQAALRHIETITRFWKDVHTPDDVSAALERSLDHVDAMEDEDRHWLFSRLGALAERHPLNETRNFPMPRLGGVTAEVIRRRIRTEWTNRQREQNGGGARW